MTGDQISDAVPGGGGVGARTIPTFRRGAWTREPHPQRIPDPNADLKVDPAETYADAGFTVFTTLNAGTGQEAPVLWARLWRGPQSASPGWLLEVAGSGGAVETVGAGDIADAMDLLSRWAPALQAALFSRLAGDARYVAENMHEYNLFAGIGAHVADGADQREEWGRAQRRRREQRRGTAGGR